MALNCIHSHIRCWCSEFKVRFYLKQWYSDMILDPHRYSFWKAEWDIRRSSDFRVRNWCHYRKRVLFLLSKYNRPYRVCWICSITSVCVRVLSQGGQRSDYWDVPDRNCFWRFAQVLVLFSFNVFTDLSSDGFILHQPYVLGYSRWKKLTLRLA